MHIPVTVRSALLLHTGTVLEREPDIETTEVYTVCLVVVITLESVVCVSVTVAVGVMALSAVDDTSSIVCRSEDTKLLPIVECVLGNRLDVAGVVGRL